MSSTKTKVVPLRVSPAEHETWKNAAKGDGMSFNAWARQSLNSAAELGRAIRRMEEREARQPTQNETAPMRDTSGPSPVRDKRRPRSSMCPHRVQPGAFCKRCD